ncbi:MAG: nuclear transport factor 2 family protein [Vulcanimicrobiaceae bacterium]
MRSTKDVVEDLIGAWQQNDAHRAAAFFAPQARYHEASGNVVEGREAIQEHFARYFRDGPAWRLEVECIIAQDDHAAVTYRFGIKRSSDRWNERAGCAFVRCHDGAVAEWREYQSEGL